MSYSRLSPAPFVSVLLVSTNRCRHVRQHVDGKRALLSYYWNRSTTVRCTVAPQQGGGWIVELHKQEGNICHFSQHFDNASDVRAIIWGVANNIDNDLAAVIAGSWKVFHESK